VGGRPRDRRNDLQVTHADHHLGHHVAEFHRLYRSLELVARAEHVRSSREESEESQGVRYAGLAATHLPPLGPFGPFLLPVKFPGRPRVSAGKPSPQLASTRSVL